MTGTTPYHATEINSGSGVASAAYSTVDSYGQVQPSGSITVGVNGSYSFTLNLVASRNGSDKNGRTYTVTIVARDKAGNVSQASVVITARPRKIGAPS